MYRGSRHTCRPGIVAGRNLTRFAMHNITLRDSPRFVICTHGLNGATFTNVTIDSAGERNTDGFHIQGRDVYIGQSSVTNDDDCVPISGDSSNITVEDLECRSGNGLVPIIWYAHDPHLTGSQASIDLTVWLRRRAHHHEWTGAETDDPDGVIEDIVFRRCKLLSTGTGIAVKSEAQFAGTVRNVLWEDIEMEGVREAVLINMFGQNVERAELGEGLGASRPAMMQLHNLTMRNVVVRGAKIAGKIMCGNGTHACDGVTMVNVSMEDVGAWQCGGEVSGTARDCSPQPCFASAPVDAQSSRGLGEPLQPCFDPVDATDCIQQALNQTASSHVHLANLGKPWIVRPLFIRRSNLLVTFAPGVVVSAKAGEFKGHDDSLVSITGASNVSLVGQSGNTAWDPAHPERSTQMPTLRMRKKDCESPSVSPSCARSC